MESRCRDEIIQLHEFFEKWYLGELDDTDTVFERCSRALAPDFLWISPDGEILEGGGVLPTIRDAHGSRMSFRLWVESPVCRMIQGDLYLFTYEEWQQADGDTTRRISSALLKSEPSAPNGVVWLHVHETWADPHVSAGPTEHTEPGISAGPR
jgi:hypothetical protein